MIPHDQDHPIFTYDLKTERQAILSTKNRRNVPQKDPNKLLTAVRLIDSLFCSGLDRRKKKKDVVPKDYAATG